MRSDKILYNIHENSCAAMAGFSNISTRQDNDPLILKNENGFIKDRTKKKLIMNRLLNKNKKGLYYDESLF